MLLEQEIIKWRHQLHQNPEFSFEERMTSAMVAEKLKSFGIEVHQNIGKTGVVGILKCGNSSHSIGLRADMDALKIEEQNKFDHVSRQKGLMA